MRIKEEILTINLEVERSTFPLGGHGLSEAHSTRSVNVADTSFLMDFFDIGRPDLIRSVLGHVWLPHGVAAQCSGLMSELGVWSTQIAYPEVKALTWSLKHGVYEMVEGDSADIGVIAAAMNYPIATVTYASDRAIRGAIESLGGNYSGTISVLAKSVSSGISTEAEAIEMYQEMLAANRWLPKDISILHDSISKAI